MEGGQILFSPVTLADLNDDNRAEVLVGTTDGKVFALTYDSNSDGLVNYWTRDMSAALGGPTSIHAAISAGDLNNDGNMDVVVATGDAGSYRGSVAALNGQTGAILWIHLTYDISNYAFDTGLPDGLSDPVVSTPALGDLNNDGKLEIVFGSWDFRLYVLDADGNTLPNWPKFMRDTIWSSPAIADIDNDGINELIIGNDTHAEGPPFSTPDGGGIYVFHADGTSLPGWPKFIGQTIYSSPAIGDLDGDGMLEIVHGTGDYYNNPAEGNKVYVWSAQGNLLWTGTTNDYVRGSPALADLNGDGKLDVIAAAKDDKVYAWRHDGGVLWTAAPTDVSGNNRGLVSALPIVAEFNDDGHPDVFINVGWDCAVISGNDGTQLTQEYYPNNSKPGFQGGYTTATNAPALGDVTGDGNLDLVVAASNNTGTVGKVSLWKLNTPASKANMPWPMFGQNAQNTRTIGHTNPSFGAELVSQDMPKQMRPGQTLDVQVALRNTGSSNWTSSTKLGAWGDSDPFNSTTRFALADGEIVGPGESKTFTIKLRAPLGGGFLHTDWRMFNESTGQWFGIQAASDIKVGNEPALYVLTTDGVHPVGWASAMAPPPGFSNWPASAAFDLSPDKQGYQLLDNEGGRWLGGLAWPLYPGGRRITMKDIVTGPDGISTFELRDNGQIYGCDPAGCNRSFTPPIPTNIQAQSLAVTPNGTGVYVVDGFGNIYAGGTAPAISPPAGLPDSNNIVRRVKLAPDGTGLYLMDIYGRVWPAGGASAIDAGYNLHMGEDWARDFDLTEDGKGYYLLDKNNGISVGGNAAPVTANLPPLTTTDTGRDIELADGRRLPPEVIPPLPLKVYMPLGLR